MSSSEFRHVKNLWDDAKARNLAPLLELVYRSNLLGANLSITNTGGGNTSAKLIEKDPLTGDDVTVLWVKGSGGDLRTSDATNFASLALDRVLLLEKTYKKSAMRGPKTPIEDRMVAAYPHCTFNLNPRAASIDTPLHAFLPAKHVDHMHPNAVISIAAAARGAELTREIWGDDLVWMPWQRPGFDLGLALRDTAAKHPKASGVVMGQHGVISWADDGKSCYLKSLEIAEKAARFIAAKDRGEKTFGGRKYADLSADARRSALLRIVPFLRGRVSTKQKMIATVQTDDAVLRFASSHDAARLCELGTSCPDHFLRTKIRPLFVDWNPEKESTGDLEKKLEAGLSLYRESYAAYYERCKRPDSPAMRDANPTVFIVPGIGMIAFGKTKSESRVTAEFFNCAIEVMRGAEAVDRYIALPEQEAFDIEYWLLEDAKLKRMPPEKEWAREVVVIVGAGSGIGRSTAQRMAADGAHVVCADVDLSAAQATAKELTKIHGEGIGVAGTGVSGAGPAIACAVDIRDRASVRALFEDAVIAYGGIDHVVVTAGIYVAPDTAGAIPDEAWRTTFDINVRGAFLVADEAKRVWAAQDLRGTLTVTTSVNGVVAKRGSLAYDVSKAAANHLVRELAIDLAPRIRVNAVAPATVVAGSSMFPRDRVIASLAKYGLAWSDAEDTEVLRARLAEFYAKRTLTGLPVLPEDQAEAVAFLASRRSAKTTGQIISVDGGLADAFLR